MWRRIIGGVTIDEAMRTISHHGNWYPIFDLLNKTRNSEIQLKHTACYKTYHITNESHKTIAELDKLDKDIRNGDINSFKLIRGTFLEKNYKDQEDGDDAFDSAVRMVIHSARRRPDIRLLIATHNRESIRKAIFEANMNLKNNDYEPSSKQVQFALASGIGDAAEQIILKHGYIIHRYMHYGPYVRKYMVVSD